MPLLVFSSASTCLTITRSAKGLSFMFLVLVGSARRTTRSLSFKVHSSDRRFTCPFRPCHPCRPCHRGHGDGRRRLLPSPWASQRRCSRSSEAESPLRPRSEEHFVRPLSGSEFQL